MTNFFCLSYALVNLSAFVLRITGAPNFRPRFKACTWQVALTGALLNFAIMFYTNWVYDSFFYLHTIDKLLFLLLL